MSLSAAPRRAAFSLRMPVSPVRIGGRANLPVDVTIS
jgi:hypothetical protein